MHINDSGTEVTLSFEEMKKIVNGKFTTFKCVSCEGKGWYWVDGNGTKRDPKPGEDLNDFYQHPCNFDDNDCGGLGFGIVIKE